MQKRSVLCVAVGGAICLAVPVRADIKYTQVTNVPSENGKSGKESVTPLSTITTYVRQGEQRTDTTQQVGPAKMNETSFTNCAKKQVVRMDAGLKIYTVDTLGGADSGDAAGDKKANATDAKETGKMVSTVSVQTLGMETIAGYQARHSMITTRLQTSGCAGDTDTTMKQEVWVADVPMPVFDCGESGNSSAQYAGTTDDCKMSFEQKGDIEAYAAAMKGVVVRMKMYEGKTNKVTMVQETTLVSLAKLEDTDFAIPAGFKKLNAAEYANARQQAMIKAMTNAAADNADAGDKNGDDKATDDKEAKGDDNEVKELGKEIENDNKARAKEAAKNKVRNKLRLPF